MARKAVLAVLALALSGLGALAGCRSTDDPKTADAYIKAKKRTGYYREAVDLVKSGDFEEAAGKYRQALRWVPDDRRSWIGLAWCSFSMGVETNQSARFDKGHSEGKEWDDIKKEWVPAEPPKYSPEERKRLAAEAERKYGEAIRTWEDAMEAARHALQLREDPDAFHVIAFISIYLGKIEQAKEAIEKILDDSTVRDEMREKWRNTYEIITKIERDLEDKDAAKKIKDEFPEIKPPDWDE